MPNQVNQMGDGKWRETNSSDSTEICQSCLKRLSANLIIPAVIRLGSLERAYRLCRECNGELKKMILGYMGEVKPNDGGVAPAITCGPICKCSTSNILGGGS